MLIITLNTKILPNISQREEEIPKLNALLILFTNFNKESPQHQTEYSRIISCMFSPPGTSSALSQSAQQHKNKDNHH